jgi:hypothetical protein
VNNRTIDKLTKNKGMKIRIDKPLLESSEIITTTNITEIGINLQPTPPLRKGRQILVHNVRKETRSLSFKWIFIRHITDFVFGHYLQCALKSNSQARETHSYIH